MPMIWNEGYRTDISYTYGYYQDLNPANMRLCLLMAGIMPPEVTQACELGYGQGVSINIHAAAEAVAWTGTDFNPSQAGLAQAMARASGAAVHCHADSFKDFCQRGDLPQFDYIAMHGIWSWISAENQEAILSLIRNNLRVGGVLYISYDTYPGWASFHPTAKLMKAYINRQDGANQGIGKLFKEAEAFIQRLDACGSKYLKNNPSVKERLANFDKLNKNYVIHELFNTYLEPSYFYEMAEILGEARMTWACSANPIACIPGVGLSPQQKDILAGISDPVLKESIKDFIFNTQFRKDFFIKGPRPMGIHARHTALGQERFVLTTLPCKLPGEFKTQIGKIAIPELILDVIRKTFADGGQHTLAELEKNAQIPGAAADTPKEPEQINFPTLLHAMVSLMAGGYAALAQDDQTASKARQYTDRLNLFIAEQAIDSGNIANMASPVTGGGTNLGRFEQLFWLAMKRGARTSAEMARFAWECIASAGQAIVENGQALQKPEEARAYLQERADAYIANLLPVLKALQVA